MNYPTGIDIERPGNIKIHRMLAAYFSKVEDSVIFLKYSCFLTSRLSCISPLNIPYEHVTDVAPTSNHNRVSTDMILLYHKLMCKDEFAVI